MIRDADAAENLIPKALELISNNKELEKLAANIVLLAQKNSADRIADEVFKIIKTGTR